MIACIRGGQLDQDDRATYFKQVELNQQYIRKFVASVYIDTSFAQLVAQVALTKSGQY